MQKSVPAALTAKSTFPDFIQQAYNDLFSADQRRYIEGHGARLQRDRILRLMTVCADIGAQKALADAQVEMMRALATSTYRFDRHAQAFELLRAMIADPTFIFTDSDREQMAKIIAEARRELTDEDKGKIEILFDAMFQKATGIDPNEEGG